MATLQVAAAWPATQRGTRASGSHAAARSMCWARLQAARPAQQQQPTLPLRRRQQRRVAQAAAAAGAGTSSSSAPPAASSAAGRPGDEYFAADQRPVILFDGVCNLCNGGVNFMLTWDREGAYRFAALQSPAGRALLQRSGRAPDDISSIVLVERGQSFVKSAAVLRIATRLRAPLPLVAAALDGAFPLAFKDWFYEQVADNRYSLFGRTQSCRLSDPRFDDRFLAP